MFHTRGHTNTYKILQADIKWTYDVMQYNMIKIVMCRAAAITEALDCTEFNYC